MVILVQNYKKAVIYLLFVWSFSSGILSFSCFLCYCMACFIFSVLYFLHDILYFFYFLCCIFHLTSFIFYCFLNIFQKYPPACYYTSKYFADIINSILCLTEYMEVFGTCLDFYITDSRSPAVSKDRHAIIMEEKSAF